MILVLLVFAAIAAMLAAGVSPLLFGLHRAAHIHLAFALGVMPMILAAMTHFVPVLTRTRGPARGVEIFAVLAWAGGALAVAFFAFTLPEGFRNAAAVLALLAGIGLVAWQIGRGRAALGGAHPGLYWYLAALACLAAGLLAVPAMTLWPQEALALKRLHLHLNLLGFVGMTALGTLQVLLPTASGRPDPDAAGRLRNGLPLAMGGTLLIASGAAWVPSLTWAGLVLWCVPLFLLARSWFERYRDAILCRHGAAPLLVAALMGFFLALVAGALHGAGWGGSAGVGHLLVFSFLFPLVSGAAGQLLPLWLRPGRQTEWHDLARRQLTYGSAVRAILLLGGGILALTGSRWGAVPALAGMLPFAFAALRVFVRSLRA